MLHGKEQGLIYLFLSLSSLFANMDSKKGPGPFSLDVLARSSPVHLGINR
jgi:hypothetical protein